MRIALIATAALLAACQTMTPEDGPIASAALKPTKGSKAFGEATFEQVGDKVKVVVFVQGLKAGQAHGLHIHEAGDCSSGDGMSAKGHFNPGGHAHGNPTAGEHHAGDLPALKADKRGRAHVIVELEGISVTPGPNSIVGRGIIVHAGPDDFKTQPTGDSGARLACGVIQLN